MQKTQMKTFRNLRWGYISDAASCFSTLKRSINWLWERVCVSQADVLLSGRADSTLSDHHITCSIYINQVSEIVLTNRSLNFDVRTQQPHRADTCIFQHMSHATYQLRTVPHKPAIQFIFSSAPPDRVKSDNFSTTSTLTPPPPTLGIVWWPTCT